MKNAPKKSPESPNIVNKVPRNIFFQILCFIALNPPLRIVVLPFVQKNIPFVIDITSYFITRKKESGMRIIFVRMIKNGSEAAIMRQVTKGDTVTSFLEGELDQHSAQAVRTELETAIQNPQIRHMVLDVSNLSFMDSSGIGVVIGRYKTLQKRGGTLVISNPSPRVDRIFQLSGLYQIVGRK